MVAVPSWGLLPLEGCKQPVQIREASLVLCPPFMGKSLEQEDTTVMYSTAWLYPTVKVRSVKLFLIQKQQLKLESV